MNDELRHLIIEKVRRGEQLPGEWQSILFPQDKNECELVYHGKQRKEDVLADTMTVPLQPVRSFGKNGSAWQNLLIFGDNLQVMKTLLESKKNGTLCNADGTPGARLIYIDPPFATQQEFRGTQDQKAYQDKIAGTRFIEFIRRRLILARELLSDNGSIYLHLDTRKSHYIKALMDEVFGENNFRNEIIWYYRKFQMRGMRVFANNSERVLWYAKSGDHVYNPQTVPLDVPKYLKRKKWDKDLSRIVNVKDAKGHLIYDKYEDEKVDDVWDIPFMGATSPERLGYPTQKPEVLLRRVIETATNPEDLVMDVFAGSGTTLASAEKLGRRWVGVDCGKLAIYTIQKRMLNLTRGKGKKAVALEPKSFTLHNAGLYDFSKLKELRWEDWRFFALKLFGCKDEPHKVGGLKLDGKLKGASVLVFNHHENKGRRIDEETIDDIHAALGKRIGNRFFIIAPRGVFDFQQDYIDLDGVRYYALRIPYSVINELHQREFTALSQPNDEGAVNDIVDAWGFDFIQPPAVDYTTGRTKNDSEAFLKLKKFQSRARLGGANVRGGLESFSMLMLDFNYDGNLFKLDRFYFAHQLKEANWECRFPAREIGEQVMAVFIDLHGNEARDVIPRSKFGVKQKENKGRSRVGV